MKKSRYLEILAVHLAAGKSIREATAYGISGSAEFRQRVSEIRAELTCQAVGKLSDAASLAVDTLRSLLDAANEPAIRLQAAKAILTMLGPISESNELRQRLTDLEQSTTPILKVMR